MRIQCPPDTAIVRTCSRNPARVGIMPVSTFRHIAVCRGPEGADAGEGDEKAPATPNEQVHSSRTRTTIPPTRPILPALVCLLNQGRNPPRCGGGGYAPGIVG